MFKYIISSICEFKICNDVIGKWLFFFILSYILSNSLIAAELNGVIENGIEKINIVPITQTINNCLAAGFKPVETVSPESSKLKNVTSLIGLAYLNYIYQNDPVNKHFCESMLLMKSQTKNEEQNPYVKLFEPALAPKTILILKDIQLSFDYAIDRTRVPINIIQASVDKVNKIIAD